MEAVQLLKKVRPNGNELGNALDVLLGFKTNAAYGAENLSADTMKRAQRAAARLIDAARDRLQG